MRYLTEEPPRLWRRPRRAPRVRGYVLPLPPGLDVLHRVLDGLHRLAVTS